MFNSTNNPPSFADNISHPRLGKVINDAWKIEVNGSLCNKLKQANTSTALKKWNKEEYGHCQTKIKELPNSIEKIQHLEANE